MVRRDANGLANRADSCSPLARRPRVFKRSAGIGFKHLGRRDEVAAYRLGIELRQASQLTSNRGVEQARVGAIGDAGLNNAVTDRLYLSPPGSPRTPRTRPVWPPTFRTPPIGGSPVRAAAARCRTFRPTAFGAAALDNSPLRTTPLRT